ncbi:MAG: hypothetical protein HC888_17520, partial [Candidatus Competibacteraceae bacterium]|nr:hypothetical protein [Candidatus Competibacteraceae bacterium]
WVYLSRIGYADRYRIDFILEDREDCRVDARGTFQARLSKRLARVEVRFDANLIRAYRFSYQYNEFGQSHLASMTEEDSAGGDLYTYRFEYERLAERVDEGGASPGFDAFGGAEEIWGGDGSDRFDRPQKTVTSGAGGSLYIGLEVNYWVPYFIGIRKANLFRLGARGGLGFSNTATLSSLLDVNGDGLPDVVWKDGASLYGYPNLNGAFDAATPSG